MPVIVIVGPDSALAHEHLHRELARLDPGGMGRSMLDLKSVTTADAVAAVATLPFFGDGRVVVLAGTFSSRAQAGDDDLASRGNALDLAQVVGSVAAGNALILFDPAAGGVPAAIRKAIPPDTTVLSGAAPRGPELVAWVRRAAEAAGSGIDPEGAQLLLGLTYPQTWRSMPSNPAFDTPPDLQRLRMDIEKLALFAWPGSITPSVVREMIPAATEDRIFSLLDAILAGNTGDALVEVERLLAAGEEPAKVVAMALGSAELAGPAGTAGMPGDAATAGKELGLASGGRLAATGRAIGRSPQRASRAVARGVATERALKSGRIRSPLDQLYALVIGTDESGEQKRRG